jgi:hypothetical protein
LAHVVSESVARRSLYVLQGLRHVLRHSLQQS